MAFRFSLQALLQLRRSFERHERLRLQALTRRLVQLREQFEASVRENLAARQRLAQSLAKGTVGAEIRFEANWGSRKGATPGNTGTADGGVGTAARCPTNRLPTGAAAPQDLGEPARPPTRPASPDGSAPRARAIGRPVPGPPRRSSPQLVVARYPANFSPRGELFPRDDRTPLSKSGNLLGFHRH